MSESDTKIVLLKKLMDGCAARQIVLANNLANANTPGFTRSDLSFREALAGALDSHDSRALAGLRPKLEVDKNSSAREDGNNVSAQKELGMMAQNGLLYEVTTRALSSSYARLLAAIKGQ